MNSETLAFIAGLVVGVGISVVVIRILLAKIEKSTKELTKLLERKVAQNEPKNS